MTVMICMTELNELLMSPLQQGVIAIIVSVKIQCMSLSSQVPRRLLKCVIIYTHLGMLILYTEHCTMLFHNWGGYYNSLRLQTLELLTGRAEAVPRYNNTPRYVSSCLTGCYYIQGFIRYCSNGIIVCYKCM